MRLAWIICALGALAFLALTIVSPAAGAGGWLIAFVAVGAAPVGALVWSLIGRLTGGAWSGAPNLRRLAVAAPGLLAAAVPLLLAAPLIYPAARSSLSFADFLSPLAWTARSVVILGGLGLIAVVAARSRSKLFAAVALVFYGASVGLMAVDWLFALTPGWISSAGGMALAVQQLGTGLGAALVLGEADDRRRRDLAALLVATLLGALYFDLMSYTVVWYGDQSDKTSFYRVRSGAVSLALMGGVVGLRLLAIGVIALHRRMGPWAYRAAAGLALAGFWLETAWMVAPVTGEMGLLTGALATIALGAALTGWIRRADPAQGTVVYV